MPQSNKYGNVTLERGSIPDDEPVFIFRGQDKILPVVLNFYFAKCREMGSPQHHLDLIAESTRQVIDWQAQNFTKLPSSDAYAPQTPADPHNPGFTPTPAQQPSQGQEGAQA